MVEENVKDVMLDVKSDLKQKAQVRVGDVVVSESMLNEAENIIADMREEYLVWVKEDLVRLDTAFAEFAEELAIAPLHRIFEIAHDMKGQGGSFGFNLVTAVANSLCRIIEVLEKKTSPCDDKEVSAVKLHVDTIKLIINERITGDGGDTGRQLLDGIDAVKRKLNM